MVPSPSRARYHGRVALSVVLAILQLLLATAIVMAWSEPAQGQSVQSSVSTVASYVVDVELEQVSVTERFAVAPSVTSFEAFVPHEVSEVVVSASFERSSRDPFWDVVTVYPSGAPWVDLSYTVASSEVRTERGARVNDSFIGFRIWPINADEVSIVIPDGYVIAENRGLFEITRLPTGQLNYVANFPADLQDYSFVAFSGESFESRVIHIEGDSIQIAGWIGDDTWLDHTELYLRSGLPVLRELIGLPWPERGLEIVESARPGDLGYAGWYNGSRSNIEISDTLNEETLLHELSHAWFNGSTYVDRWIIEGLAEELSSAALLRIDDVETNPTELGPAPEGWDGLMNWQNRFRSGHSWEVEVYGYEASWFVLDALSDEIGEAQMRAVLVEMQSDLPAYGLESDPKLNTPNDWRRFLDVLEDVGGSAQAEAIYREWVMPADLEFVLDTRTRTRQSLEEFSNGDLASVPLGIRRATARWEFDNADAQLAEALTYRNEIDQLIERAARLDLEVPGIISEEFLTSGPAFGTLRQSLDQASETLGWLEEGNGDPEDYRNWSQGNFGNVEAKALAADDAFGRELNADQSQDVFAEWLRWAIPISALLFVILGCSLLISRLGTAEEPIPGDPFVT